MTLDRLGAMRACPLIRLRRNLVQREGLLSFLMLHVG
jgi:hypothetical protein